MVISGFLEIVQLLLNRANNTEHIKRMLESIDSEGDTVSIFLPLKFEFLFIEAEVNPTNITTYYKYNNTDYLKLVSFVCFFRMLGWGVQCVKIPAQSQFLILFHLCLPISCDHFCSLFIMLQEVSMPM